MQHLSYQMKYLFIIFDYYILLQLNEEQKNAGTSSTNDPSSHQFKPSLAEEMETKKARVAELEMKYAELRKKAEDMEAEH